MLLMKIYFGINIVERIKILLQVQEASKQIRKSKQYTGIINTAFRVPREQGFLSLWRGNLVNVIRYFPNQALNFAFKDVYQNIFSNTIFFNESNSSITRITIKNLLAGGLAGATSLALTYPLELIRTRMGADVSGKNQTRLYGGSISKCAKQIYKTEGGIKGLYRGFGMSVAIVFPYRGLYFGGYDTAKTLLLTDPKTAPFYQLWMISQVITISAQYVLYPFDTIRRRLQLNGGSDRVYDGYRDCCKKILKNEGLGGFYKGALANSVRASGGALVLVLVDKLKFLFQQ
eukprot:TRINITY_DN9235_c0_g1_i2.p1 TRINITY_DN9235_c0_g1~~TRINITY_DN9235_c0_g1_i2.p1  ORF type:complete len:298 (+),score=86.77 TRINITY_DN9235_c0_g1_i2:31-894(+)